MNLNQIQLLCTFATKNTYKDKVAKIKSFYESSFNKIFIFSNIENNTEYFITYSVTGRATNNQKLEDTILVHRKKEYNTLYTLNTMNVLIKKENNGIFDKTYKLNWDLYKNSLLLIADNQAKIIPLQLEEIIF